MSVIRKILVKVMDKLKYVSNGMLSAIILSLKIILFGTILLFILGFLWPFFGLINDWLYAHSKVICIWIILYIVYLCVVKFFNKIQRMSEDIRSLSEQIEYLTAVLDKNLVRLEKDKDF